MIERRIRFDLIARLEQAPAVALLGPRQVGKTTLAREIGETRASLYLDLESDADRVKLADPELYLAAPEDKLVILDEVHRLPGLFQILRGLIDEGRRNSRKSGRFLLLGSASIDLLAQTGESLAGRISYLEMHPLDAFETAPEEIGRLWTRGGFPDSFLAASDQVSQRWRRDFIRTYLERDIPSLGPRIAAETLRRFWTMLAHQRSGLLNAAELRVHIIHPACFPPQPCSDDEKAMRTVTFELGNEAGLPVEIGLHCGGGIVRSLVRPLVDVAAGPLINRGRLEREPRGYPGRSAAAQHFHLVPSGKVGR
jgi:predicted AAA+ superfamily ATPase